MRLLLVLSLAACSPETGLEGPGSTRSLADAATGSDPAEPRPGEDSGAPSLEPMQVAPIPEDTDWTGGFTLSGELPFQATRLVVVAEPGVTVEVLPPGAEDWVALEYVSTEGSHRIAELGFSSPIEALELRADGPVSYAQAELFTGDIWYDDEGAIEGDEGARAIAGDWAPDSQTLSIGMTMYLPYESADECVGTTLPGTRILADWLVANTEGGSHGTYACRRIRGGSGMSVHSEGRAIDLFVRLDGGQADNDLGDPIAAYLIEHAEEIGISLIIWDRASWGAHRSGDKHQHYSGSHPHHDHLHIELTTDGALGLRPWFGAPVPFGAEDAVEGWVDIAPTPSGRGYWLAHSDGRVEAFGDAIHHGDPSGLALAGPIVGIASLPTGSGYCLGATDGGVFCHGDAGYYGSMGSTHLNAPVTDIAMKPDGRGYWLVAEDGGVFSFGSAGFHGSMGGETLNGRVVSMTSSPTGRGYWLAGADGGIFSFGDARFHGSMGDETLHSPVSGMAASSDGYWMFAEDGGVFAFGDAGFEGSLGGVALQAAVHGGAPTPSLGGYWMVGLDGGVFSFGDARYYGNGLE